jgi:hypothetical protein
MTVSHATFVEPGGATHLTNKKQEKLKNRFRVVGKFREVAIVNFLPGGVNTIQFPKKRGISKYLLRVATKLHSITRPSLAY